MCGCSEQKMRYELYRSNNPELNIEVAYPSGWTVMERRDRKLGYSNVIFIEKDPKKTFRPMLVVTAKRSSSLKGEAKTAKDYANAIAAARMKLQPAKMLLESDASIAGAPAWEVLVSYQAVEKPHSASAKPVAAMEKTAVLQKGGNFYILRFQARQEEYRAYEKVFSRAAKTLRLI